FMGKGKGGFERDGGGDESPKTSPLTIPKRAHFITSNERTNTVLVTGPADKVSDAEAILKKIDIKHNESAKPILVGDPILKVYTVPPGEAEVLAKTLQEAYKAS